MKLYDDVFCKVERNELTKVVLNRDEFESVLIQVNMITPPNHKELRALHISDNGPGMNH